MPPALLSLLFPQELEWVEWEIQPQWLEARGSLPLPEAPCTPLASCFWCSGSSATVSSSS